MSRRHPGRAVPPPRSRGGFAIAVVVFLLFAVGVASAAAYQLVSLEVELADQTGDASDALAAADAGLARFVGEQLGVPADSAAYVLDDAQVVVRSRRVAAVDSVTDVYLLESTAQVVDPRSPGAPARRVVRQYAHLRKDPVGLLAALAVPAPLELGPGGVVDGADLATGADPLLGDTCAGAGLHPRAGLASPTGAVSGGAPLGVPPTRALGSWEALYDSVKVRWDVLQSPSFALRHDAGDVPFFLGLPADSFPVVRAGEDLSPGSGDWQWWGGRGVLIVPGTFRATGSFSWNGIILAGEIDELAGDAPPGNGRIRGLVVGGLDGPQGEVRVENYTVAYHSCWARLASRSLAYLEPVGESWWDGL